MKCKPSSRLTVVLFADADRPVRKWHIPRKLLQWGSVCCTVIIAFVLYSQYDIFHTYELRISELQGALRSSESIYKQEITARDDHIQQLEQQIMTLSDQTEEVQKELVKLQQLEMELRKITGITPESDQITTRSTSLPSYVQAKQTIQQLSPMLQQHLDRLREQQKQLEHTPTIWPTDSRKVTSGFGYRRDPFHGSTVFHEGIDIAAEIGATVYATASGTVEEQGTDDVKGIYIVLSHGYDFHTVYMHLSESFVAEGETITKGEAIGTVGSTGRSTGPHLHYEIQVSRKAINPIMYLNSES